MERGEQRRGPSSGPGRCNGGRRQWWAAATADWWQKLRSEVNSSSPTPSSFNFIIFFNKLQKAKNEVQV
ncbi:unnamed protein product [Cuscuta campestris]|uniref:Uncharacterized protein n=1 Tax=Cuscuta campestris TaxID=132261 RepID=A0A484M252_9ASTE|nr:unnamed protein product [Cuscuta campestris]